MPYLPENIPRTTELHYHSRVTSTAYAYALQARSTIQSVFQEEIYSSHTYRT